MASYPGVLPLLCQAHHSRLLCSGSECTGRSASRRLCPAEPPQTDPALLTGPSLALWFCSHSSRETGQHVCLGKELPGPPQSGLWWVLPSSVRNCVWHVPFFPPCRDGGMWIPGCSFPLLSRPQGTYLLSICGVGRLVPGRNRKWPQCVWRGGDTVLRFLMYSLLVFEVINLCY